MNINNNVSVSEILSMDKFLNGNTHNEDLYKIKLKLHAIGQFGVISVTCRLLKGLPRVIRNGNL